jgi:adenine deaminase
MKVEKEALKRRIDVAAGREQADLVIKNVQIIDVFNSEIIRGENVAVVDGYFVGIGQYEGKKEINAEGKYICPSFIDGHVHIESSMVPPAEMAKVLLAQGVTAIVADPHEIANVAGVKGIQYMLDASEGINLDVFIMLPSSVPATSFEHAGAVLQAEDLAPLYIHSRVIGLAEVMDFPAVLHAEDKMLDKLLGARQSGAQIDGHAAGLDQTGLNVYMAAGIRTDHESVSAKEAKERLQRGMYLMIREGSVAKDLKALIEVVTPHNTRRCVFVTDDKHMDDLLEEGSVDHNIRLAIEGGLDPIQAIQMATLNTAECFGFTHKGAIAPGYEADFLLLDDLSTIAIRQVFKAGKLVAEKGTVVSSVNRKDLHSTLSIPIPLELSSSIRLQEVKEDQLRINIEENACAHIIEIIPNSLITKHVVEEVEVQSGCFVPSIQNDHLKLAVIERHHRTGNVGLGIVKGLGLQSGAIATTVAHDSHNLIVAGTNDEDMLLAVKEIERMNGGLVVVQNGKILASLALPIAGLMTDQDAFYVNQKLNELKYGLTALGAPTHFNPFLTLSFLALPVIPDLKLTDLGLFDVKEFKHIKIDVE